MHSRGYMGGAFEIPLAYQSACGWLYQRLIKKGTQAHVTIHEIDAVTIDQLKQYVDDNIISLEVACTEHVGII